MLEDTTFKLYSVLVAYLGHVQVPNMHSKLKHFLAELVCSSFQLLCSEVWICQRIGCNSYEISGCKEALNGLLVKYDSPCLAVLQCSEEFLQMLKGGH